MSEFTNRDWKQVISYLTEVIGPEAEGYTNVPAAKLTAAIPYLAGSEDPDRFAVSNLLTFHAATKARGLFNHRSTDDQDPLRRLATFHVGRQANREVVDYGLNLLTSISLADHEHDAVDDKKAGKYNPVNARKWDAAKLRRELNTKLAQSVTLSAAFASVIVAGGALNSWN